MGNAHRSQLLTKASYGPTAKREREKLNEFLFNDMSLR
jgi:hypothetical protein